LGPKAGWCWLLELADRSTDAGGELDVRPEDGGLGVGVVGVVGATVGVGVSTTGWLVVWVGRGAERVVPWWRTAVE
jgi:hypothetical protein